MRDEGQLWFRVTMVHGAWLLMVHGSGFTVNFGFRVTMVHGAWFMVTYGSRFRVQGSRFRVKGVG